MKSFVQLLLLYVDMLEGVGIAGICGKDQLCGAGSFLQPLTWVLVIELRVLRLLWLTC